MFADYGKDTGKPTGKVKSGNLQQEEQEEYNLFPDRAKYKPMKTKTPEPLIIRDEMLRPGDMYYQTSVGKDTLPLINSPITDMMVRTPTYKQEFPNLPIFVEPKPRPTSLQPIHYILLTVIAFVLYSFKGK